MHVDFIQEYAYLGFYIAKALLFVYAIHNISLGIVRYSLEIAFDKQKENEPKKVKKSDNGFENI